MDPNWLLSPFDSSMLSISFLLYVWAILLNCKSGVQKTDKTQSHLYINTNVLKMLECNHMGGGVNFVCTAIRKTSSLFCCIISYAYAIVISTTCIVKKSLEMRNPLRLGLYLTASTADRSANLSIHKHVCIYVYVYIHACI